MYACAQKEACEKEKQDATGWWTPETSWIKKTLTFRCSPKQVDT